MSESAAVPTTTMREPWPSWRSTLSTLAVGLGATGVGLVAMSYAFDQSVGHSWQEILLLVGGLILLIGLATGLVGFVMLPIKLLRLLLAAAKSSPPPARLDPR